jgi:hypothetical protein
VTTIVDLASAGFAEAMADMCSVLKAEIAQPCREENGEQMLSLTS